ncbi:MAG: hypothetical protein Q8881_03630 [Sweet potato little leaf phytoplasma]|nr:hypothetical protein [Sweet potato little leaf phytoplasma]
MGMGMGMEMAMGRKIYRLQPYICWIFDEVMIAPDYGPHTTLPQPWLAAMLWLEHSQTLTVVSSAQCVAHPSQQMQNVKIMTNSSQLIKKAFFQAHK